MTPTPRRLATSAALVAAFAACASFFAGYVKDDAYISLRYARNLASGHGLVFNVGERLEGYTNFLWIALSAPSFWLGADPLVWVKAMGLGAGAAATLYVYAGARWLRRDEPDSAADGIAPLAFATSTSVSLWAMSGLEGCFMALCSVAGWLHLHRGRDRESPRELALASAWFLAAALTRPEGHALFAFGVLALLAGAAARRRVDRGILAFFGIFLAVAVPYHLFRVTYFGDWLPNTFYVKASAGPEVWEQGRKYLAEFVGFNANAALLMLAPAALAARKGAVPRLHALAVAAFFALYLAKIGRDEMKHFRLYLPALPLLCLMAGEGVRIVVAPLRRVHPRAPEAVAALAALALALPAVDYTMGHHRAEADFVRQSETGFQAMGRYMEERARPGDTAIFQDMGGAPFAAPSVRFVDTIGILDRTVARELAAIRLNPFLRHLKARQPGGNAQIAEFDRRVEEYLFDQDARWVAFTAYIGRSQRKKFGRSYDEAEGDPEAVQRLFAPSLRGNSYYHGLYADPRFARLYRLEKVWKRNVGYWLVLFEKRSEAEPPAAEVPG